MNARFKELDVVALDRDIPEHGLRRGDTGTIVMLYEPDGVEVEFVRPSGATQALLTLKASDVRALTDNDLFAVRPLRRTG